MLIAPVPRVTRQGLPIAPFAVADEAEMYAREWGRHATLHFVPTLFANGKILRGTWIIRMTLRPDDIRMKLWQEQRSDEVPTEDVWLQEPNPDAGKYVPNGGGLREPDVRPLDINQMGATGVRLFLEQGNMWSGRTEVDSPEAAVKKGQDDRAVSTEKLRKTAREEGGKLARDQRRSRLKIPYIGIIKDVTPTRAAKKPRKEK